MLTKHPVWLNETTGCALSLPNPKEMWKNELVLHLLYLAISLAAFRTEHFLCSCSLMLTLTQCWLSVMSPCWNKIIQHPSPHWVVPPSTLLGSQPCNSCVLPWWYRKWTVMWLTGHVSHTWVTTGPRTWLTAQKGREILGQWQLFSRASGEFGRLRRCKRAFVTKCSSCDDCGDSGLPHGGGVSPVSRCLRRNPDVFKSEQFSHRALCNDL